MTSLLRTAPAALAAVALLCSASAAASPEPGKAPETTSLKQITAPEGFSVRMPGEPQVMRNKVTIPGGEVVTAAWTSMVDGRIYAVSIADYPAALIAARPAQVFLDEAAVAVVNQLQGTASEKKTIALQGYPGQAFSVTSEHGEVNARNFLVGPRVYTLLVLGGPGAEAATTKAFLESLKLIDPPPVIKAAPRPSPTPTPTP